jgi:hypothetical protein
MLLVVYADRSSFMSTILLSVLLAMNKKQPFSEELKLSTTSSVTTTALLTTPTRCSAVQSKNMINSFLTDLDTRREFFELSRTYKRV